MQEVGVTEFIEIGPGKVLSGFEKLIISSCLSCWKCGDFNSPTGK